MEFQLFFNGNVWGDVLTNRKTLPRPRFHTFYAIFIAEQYSNVSKNLICILQFWKIVCNWRKMYEFFVREGVFCRFEHPLKHSNWKKYKNWKKNLLNFFTFWGWSPWDPRGPISRGSRWKFKNRYGDPSSMPLMYSQLKNEPNRPSGLGCRGGCWWFGVLHILYLCFVCNRLIDRLIS